MGLLVLVLGLLTALGPLSIDMYLPAFPDIRQSLGADPASVQLSLAVFFVGIAAGQMLYGPVSDRFGRKPPLYFGLALYALASLGCALAWSIEALIAFRLLQALGGGAGVVISRAVVRDRYNHNEAARVFSLLMLVMGLAPILAPLMGGYIALSLGWRWLFGLLVAVSLALLALVHYALPETLRRADSAAGLSLGLALANYAIVLTDRRFLGYALSNAFGLAGMFAYISGSPFVLIDLYGVAKQHFGLYFGANAFGLIALSQINARLLRSQSFDRILRLAFGVLFACGLYLLLVGWFHWPLWMLAPGLFVSVGTFGLVGPNSAAGALVNHPERAGSAAALMGTLQFSIGALASFAVSALYDGTARPMTLVMAACAALALASYAGLVGAARRPVPAT